MSMSTTNNPGAGPSWSDGVEDDLSISPAKSSAPPEKSAIPEIKFDSGFLHIGANKFHTITKLKNLTTKGLENIKDGADLTKDDISKLNKIDKQRYIAIFKNMAEKNPQCFSGNITQISASVTKKAVNITTSYATGTNKTDKLTTTTGEINSNVSRDYKKTVETIYKLLLGETGHAKGSKPGLERFQNFVNPRGSDSSRPSTTPTPPTTPRSSRISPRADNSDQTDQTTREIAYKRFSTQLRPPSVTRDDWDVNYSRETSKTSASTEGSSNPALATHRGATPDGKTPLPKLNLEGIHSPDESSKGSPRSPSRIDMTFQEEVSDDNSEDGEKIATERKSFKPISHPPLRDATIIPENDSQSVEVFHESEDNPNGGVGKEASAPAAAAAGSTKPTVTRDTEEPEARSAGAITPSDVGVNIPEDEEDTSAPGVPKRTMSEEPEHGPEGGNGVPIASIPTPAANATPSQPASPQGPASPRASPTYPDDSDDTLSSLSKSPSSQPNTPRPAEATPAAKPATHSETATVIPKDNKQPSSPASTPYHRGDHLMDKFNATTSELNKNDAERLAKDGASNPNAESIPAAALKTPAASAAPAQPPKAAESAAAPSPFKKPITESEKKPATATATAEAKTPVDPAASGPTIKSSGKPEPRVQTAPAASTEGPYGEKVSRQPNAAANMNRSAPIAAAAPIETPKLSLNESIKNAIKDLATHRYGPNGPPINEGSSLQILASFTDLPESIKREHFSANELKTFEGKVQLITTYAKQYIEDQKAMDEYAQDKRAFNALPRPRTIEESISQKKIQEELAKRSRGIMNKIGRKTPELAKLLNTAKHIKFSSNKIS